MKYLLPTGVFLIHGLVGVSFVIYWFFNCAAFCFVQYDWMDFSLIRFCSNKHTKITLLFFNNILLRRNTGISIDKLLKYK